MISVAGKSKVHQCSPRQAVCTGALLCSLLIAGAAIDGQTGATDGEWRTYGGDLANTRYSPLDQINRHNFKDLEVAWRFKTDNLGARPEFNFQSTPLMVKGRLYSTAGARRAVVALDAATGELLWMHSYQEGERGEKAPRPLSGGLAYWSDGKGNGPANALTGPGFTANWDGRSLAELADRTRLTMPVTNRARCRDRKSRTSSPSCSRPTDSLPARRSFLRRPRR